MLAPLQDALRDVKADGAELWVHRRRSAITRYAKNEIHQNAVADETCVQARVVIGKAMGIVSANSLDTADLRRLVTDALAAARESAPNADWPGFAEPAPMSEPKAYDAETARADARSQADAIKRITAAAKERGFRAAGTHQIELTEDALANTNGAAAYAPSTMAYLRALVTSDTGTGWAEDLGWSARSLDPSDVAARAIEKAALDRDRTQLVPGDYEAVFEELAVAEVLRFMSLTGLTGQTLKDGRSFMKDKFGEPVTGPRFSLWDDALDARTLAIPFVASVRRGVLITRFHYTNTPDPKRATMTGTTRDGTFLIEDGRITRALANVRYTMSALDLFSGLELLGPQRLARDWWSSNGMGSIVCLCPPIKVARATITGSSPV